MDRVWDGKGFQSWEVRKEGRFPWGENSFHKKPVVGEVCPEKSV